MPIQPILCLYFNGLLTTVDLWQKQSVLRWSHVRCSKAQWWLRTIVITEKLPHIFQPLDQQLSSGITSPWTFRSSLHGFFRVAQTDRKAEPFWRKAMVLPLHSGKVARSIVFHGGVVVYVSSLPWTHMAWEILGLWRLSQLKLCDCFGCCWHVSAIAHSSFDPACFWVFLSTGCIKVWSSCLPLAADTYSSTSIIFFIIVVIILFITPLG